jgi:hypothetical protein
MVTQGWKYLTEVTPRSDGKARLVAAPLEHMGIRNALRGVFACAEETPIDFDRLLAKIR